MVKCRNCSSTSRPIIRDNLCDLCICPVCNEEQDYYVLTYILDEEEEDEPEPLPCYECALEAYLATEKN